MRQELQTPHFPAEKAAYDQLTADVRAGLGAGAAELWRRATCWSVGPRSAWASLAAAAIARVGMTTASSLAVQRPVQPAADLVVRALGPLQVLKQGHRFRAARGDRPGLASS